jgi:predicted phosphoribosyltransferase
VTVPGRAEPPFADRLDAGRRLGVAVRGALGAADGDVPVVVLGLPRGGVVVAAAVAEVLGAPLDVLVVRKLGVPGQPELAFGAVAAGTRVVNTDVVRALSLEPSTMDAVAAAQEQVVRQRERDYRGVREAVPLAGQTAVLVDDGLATGATARAAVRALQALGEDRPRRVVLAVPVAPADTAASLRAEVDDFVCLLTPPWFGSVGQWYADFTQVQDDEVRALLAAG